MAVYFVLLFVLVVSLSHHVRVILSFQVGAASVFPYAARGVQAENYYDDSLDYILRDEAIARLQQLGNVSDAHGYLQRTFLSAGAVRAGILIQKWMRDAGLSTWVDDIGNVHGRADGANSSAPALLLGSHLDTVIDGGLYDGALGIVCAIAAVKALERNGQLVKFPRPVEIIAFSDEEGVRFQSTFLGSGAIAGTLSPNLLKIADKTGMSLEEVLKKNSLPGTEESLLKLKYDSQAVWGYVEVHIEQGPVLEALELPLGVVDAISGQNRLHVRIKGSAGHAGTVPMALRKDPMPAAAQAILAIEKLCKDPALISAQVLEMNDGILGSLVCTVGEVQVWPGASNVIPGEVAFTIDVRARDNTLREIVVLNVELDIRSICDSRGLSCDIEHMHEAKTVDCALSLKESLRVAASSATMELPAFRRGQTFVREQREVAIPVLSSGAGHDALAMAHLTRVGMLFVRCRHGISHSPAEHVDDKDIWAASVSLYHFLRQQMDQVATSTASCLPLKS